MSTYSPLLNEWIDSYNGKEPLLDLGCAYGINIQPVLDLGIPIIALDMEEEHLNILKQNVSPSQSHLLSCVLGSLPHEIALPDASVSGILLSEVLHFLNEFEIEPALKTIHQKLAPGGLLCITIMSIHYYDSLDKSIVEEFYRKKEMGVKWPGVIPCPDEIWETVEDSDNCSGDTFDFRKAKPEFGHFTDVEQWEEELSALGFELKRVKECQHPGYPTNIITNCRANIQIIARKPI